MIKTGNQFTDTSMQRKAVTLYFEQQKFKTE